MKLNRCVQLNYGCGRKRSRELIATGVVEVNGQVERDGHSWVDPFDVVVCQGKVLQQKERIIVLLNKPKGLLSATKDKEQETVMSLLPAGWRDELHIVGRLDKETTGLLLLTNDGDWSQRMAEPGGCGKVYEVTLESALPEGVEERFREGIYLAYEDIMTAPAELYRVSETFVRLILYEGKYHQVKRMFHAVGNRVVALHRISVGDLTLPPDLAPGEWRRLDLRDLRRE